MENGDEVQPRASAWMNFADVVSREEGHSQGQCCVFPFVWSKRAGKKKKVYAFGSQDGGDGREAGRWCPRCAALCHNLHLQITRCSHYMKIYST